MTARHRPEVTPWRVSLLLVTPFQGIQFPGQSSTDLNFGTQRNAKVLHGKLAFPLSSIRMRADGSQWEFRKLKVLCDRRCSRPASALILHRKDSRSPVRWSVDEPLTWTSTQIESSGPSRSFSSEMEMRDQFCAKKSIKPASFQTKPGLLITQTYTTLLLNSDWSRGVDSFSLKRCKCRKHL